MTKNEQLIEKLLKEKERFADTRNIFGDDNPSSEEYDMCIEYLKTNKIPNFKGDIENYEMLDYIVNDIETAYIDFGVKND